MGYAHMDRAGAERIAKRLARLAGSEDEREAREDQAAAILDKLFCNFSKEGEKEWSQKWTHVSSADVLRDRSLNCFPYDLKTAAESYLEHASWLHCREMDWVIADMMAYAEVSGTVKAIAPVPWSFDTKAAWGLSLLRIFGRILAWLVWLAITLFISSIGSLWLYGWLALTAWQQAAGWWTRRKKAALLTAMLDAYQSLDTTSPSWELTWEMLLRSRNLGAVWPTPLFRLVEDRKLGRKPKETLILPRGSKLDLKMDLRDDAQADELVDAA